MGVLFGQPKIQGDELQKCLTYLAEEWKLKAFQEKEAGLYSNVLLGYGQSIPADSRAAKEAYLTARRLVQSARELLKRRGKMRSIPEAASAMYSAWQLTYSDYLAWAETQPAVVEAIVNGMEQRGKHIQELLSQTEKSRSKAENEAEKLLKRLKLSVAEVQKLFREALAAIAAEDWQP